MTDEFFAFPKMARLSRDCVITEKLDGTNAQIYISDDGAMKFGSRNKWIAPGKSTDNYGFAGWATDNKDELLKLGPGRHFGEWWGAGIQRGYGLKEKRFSLFNVNRWADDSVRPACCHVVPTLYNGDFNTSSIAFILGMLEGNGSSAAPGFTDPEGIIIFHTAAGVAFKKTIKDDEKPKGQP